MNDNVYIRGEKMKNLTLNELVNANNNNTRTKAYITYDSKKKLLADDDTIKTLSAINTEFIDLLKMLKNVFAIAINNSDNSYVVITMYYSTTKSYEYIVCNVSTLDCVSFDSVKTAKQHISTILDSADDTEK